MKRRAVADECHADPKFDSHRLDSLKPDPLRMEATQMALTTGHKAAILVLVVDIILILLWPKTPTEPGRGGTQPIEATLLVENTFDLEFYAVTGSFSTISWDAGSVKLQSSAAYDQIISAPQRTSARYSLIQSPDSNRPKYTLSIDLNINEVGGPYQDSILPLFYVGYFCFVLDTTSTYRWPLQVWHKEKIWGDVIKDNIGASLTAPSSHHFDIVYSTGNGALIEEIYLDGQPLEGEGLPIYSYLGRTPNIEATDVAFPFHSATWEGVQAFIPKHTLHYDNAQVWSGLYVAQPFSQEILWLSNVPWWLYAIAIITSAYLLLKKGKSTKRKGGRRKKK